MATRIPYEYEEFHAKDESEWTRSIDPDSEEGQRIVAEVLSELPEGWGNKKTRKRKQSVFTGSLSAVKPG